MAWALELLNRTVERELESLAPDLQAKFLHIAELLEEFGPQHVGKPHVAPLGGGLYEMRMRGRSGIGRAVFVARPRQRLIVLLAFVKKSQRTPARYLKVARARLKELDE